MYVFEDYTTTLGDWIQSEINLERELSVGMTGMAVRRLQEWLSLCGYGLVIDGDFGPITAELVARFQADTGLPATGRVDDTTFAQLVEPLTAVLRQQLIASEPLNTALLTYAQAHLAQHPREVGGQNCGPWVRLYMRGNSGTPWAWCAGFVTFLLQQAAESLQITPPINGSFSCDSLVAQAKAAGCFVSETEARTRTIPPGSLFLVRRTATDWTHVGLVTVAHELHFETIEGNTNDDGAREGYEVCSRARGYTGKDFILLDA